MAPSPATAISRPLAVALGGLAAARRARAFHPRGSAREALVRIEAGDHPLGRLAGEHLAIVRTSRGVGLPEPLPDVLGLAVRLLEGGTPVLDLPLASSGTRTITRHLLRPARDPHRPTYSSLAPYATADGERFIVGARFDPVRRHRVSLLTSPPGDPWRTVGSIELGAALPADQAEALRYDPFTCPPWMTPVGWLNDLRQPAYRASQAHRPSA